MFSQTSFLIFILSCHCYSTNATHPFIHLTLTLYDLSICQCREMKHPVRCTKWGL